MAEPVCTLGFEQELAVCAAVPVFVVVALFVGLAVSVAVVSLKAVLLASAQPRIRL